MQINLNYSGDRYDYYEPRVEDRYYFEPYRYNYNIYAFTDSGKPISL